MEKSTQTPSLKEVVESYNHFRVEDYQRTYSWQKEQIEEFLFDLNECTTSRENHFLGTLILQEAGNKSATVVDGQQRLTTVFLLVAALRDQLVANKPAELEPKNENERKIDVLEKAYDFLCYSRKLDDYRFESSRFLRKLLNECVLSEPSKKKPVPHRDNTGKKVTLDFRKAIKIIESWVKKDLEKYPERVDKVTRVNNLLDTLFDRFIVLRVITNSLDESLDIFLTLNNRGLPLGPSDLVRGEIMKVLSGGLNDTEQVKLHKQILDDWTTILDQVEEPETFLRHYLVSTSGSKIQKKKVVSEVLDRIFDEDIVEKRKKAQLIWREIQDAANIYGSLVNPKMGGEKQYQLELLEGLGKSHRIVLLGVLGQNLDSLIEDKIVRQVFVLAFRNVMAGLNAQKLEDFYQEIVYEFRKLKDVEVLIKSLMDRASEIEFDSEKYLKNEGDSGFPGRALLHVINRSISQGANLNSLSGKTAHLEHVAPQTENESWLFALFGEDTEARKQYEETIGQIGNLTLLDGGLNSMAQRKPFAEKLKEYKKSTFLITRELCEFSDWDLDLIKKRTAWLTAMFEIYWSVEPKTAKIISFKQWCENLEK